ncbi:MAG: DUF4038 domain-containing protein [Saprospiraceae bacterium]|nr:DUF4038 domain-containing protein [Saprospiraceae bacterium]
MTIFCTVICQVEWLYGQDHSSKVRQIYHDENHNAFTSLMRFKDHMYCAFRSGEHHVYGQNGVIKILISEDGNVWRDHALIKSIQYDLRDPKLSVTPDGRMMVLIGGSEYREKELISQQTQVAFSDLEGKYFSEPVAVMIDEEIRTQRDWLWRVTWHHDIGYGIVYQGLNKTSSLVKTVDGVHYEWVTTFDLDGRPNEATIGFLENGDMCIIQRREEGNQLGYWGVSPAPFKRWIWTPMNYRLGGPDLFVLDDQTILAGTRIHNADGPSTSILLGNRYGMFKEVIKLPSGGDCSYPSFLVDGDRILMSYYSSHEGKASIYLTEILKEDLAALKTPWLKIKHDGRYLETEKNEPFFWLGGTAWELLHRLNREEVVDYLDDRHAKGFSVVQTVALAELDGINTPNAYGEKPLINNDPAQLNERYFEHVDFVFDEAARRGMYIGFLPTWGDKFNLASWGTGPLIFTPENARAYGNLLARRYLERPNLIWILGGDREPADYEDTLIIRAMAEGIRSIDQKHLMTYHPGGGKSSSDYFVGESWLQLDMIQTGHDRNAKEYQYVLNDRARLPVRPVINGEPRYEDHPNQFKPIEKGWMDEIDVRQTAYWTMLAGAAGYTYGCHDIWQMYSADQKPVNGARTSWNVALDLPGSGQVGIMRSFLKISHGKI